MIYSLTGTLAETGPGYAVLRCGGVGYLVGMPPATMGRLPALGGQLTLYTVLNVSENEVALVGFTTTAEREMFLLLRGVSGVGAKVALAILSAVPPADIALAVAAGDYKALTAASGVGPKLAQRLVLELKDKLAKGMASSGLNLADVAAAGTKEVSGAPQQAVAALVSLGYTHTEAASAVAAIDATLPTAEIIRLALQGMGKGE